MSHPSETLNHQPSDLEAPCGHRVWVSMSYDTHATCAGLILCNTPLRPRCKCDLSSMQRGLSRIGNLPEAGEKAAHKKSLWYANRSLTRSQNFSNNSSEDTHLSTIPLRLGDNGRSGGQRDAKREMEGLSFGLLLMGTSRALGGTQSRMEARREARRQLQGHCWNNPTSQDFNQTIPNMTRQNQSL